jgi:hypothetical protein
MPPKSRPRKSVSQAKPTEKAKEKCYSRYNTTARCLTPRVASPHLS